MKKYNLIGIFILLLLMFPLVASITTVAWSSVSLLSSTSNGGALRPAVAVDNNGTVHVVWMDNTDFGDYGSVDNDIVYRRFNATTKIWSPVEVISTESNDASLSPAIDVDKDGNVHVVWFDWSIYGSSSSDRDIFYKYWNLSTNTWSLTELISTEDTGECFFPSLTVDNDNNVHVVWENGTNFGINLIESEIYYKRLNHSTGFWTTTEELSTSIVDNNFFPSIDADINGDVHITWDTWRGGAGNARGPNSDIYYKRWYSNNNSWSPSVIISTESTSTSYRSKIISDSNDNLHCVWTDYTDYLGSGGSDDDIFYKMWDAVSKTWLATEVISTESNGGSFVPTIATDGSQNVHIVWFDDTSYNGAGNDQDLFYKYWNPTTNAWSTTEVLTTSSNDQSWHQAIAFDPNDRLHVVFSDRFDYVSGTSSTDNDIYYLNNSIVNTDPAVPGFDVSIIIISGLIGILSISYNIKKKKK